jgi:hypothetical protein
VGLNPELIFAVGELAQELRLAAEREARFEHAAALAAQLTAELRTQVGFASLGPRQRPAGRRRVRGPRATARRVQALRDESTALASVLAVAEDLGVRITHVDLADLRLGERTRRIFHDAGLTLVEDVASLPPERAADIPRLAPASLAELRAAILIALEAARERPAAALPPPGQPDNPFEGLVAGFNRLPPHERDILILRVGVEDRVHSVEEVARSFGCTPGQVEGAERHALNALLAQPACLEASWRIEQLCTRLGLAWDDDRLPAVVAAWYPNARARFSRLAAWLMVERARVAAEAGGRSYSLPSGVVQFEEMVVAALGRYGDLSGEALTAHVRAALPSYARERYGELWVAERVRMLGPPVTVDGKIFRLPDAPIPGLDDRHIRSINGVIGALQKLGSARISALTAEVNRRLPREYHISDDFARLWLTRHPELFTQSEEDRFRLASLDVDILCGLADPWQPSSATASAPGRPADPAQERRNERIATDIEAFLRDHGPQPISRIRSRLYGRFVKASADAVIAGDVQQRFVRLGNGLIGLVEHDAGGLTNIEQPARGARSSARADAAFGGASDGQVPHPARQARYGRSRAAGDNTH